MGAYDSSLGALLLGSWANAMLYMLECFQIIRVFNKYDDSLPMKAMLGLLWIFDTVGTAGGFATVYLYNVTYWGDKEAVALQYWTVPLYLVTSSSTAALVQGFLISRFWGLSRNITLVLIMILLGLIAFSGGIYLAVAVAMFPQFAQRHRVVTPALIWLVGTAACDIVIAAGLVWQLRNTEHWLPSVLKFHRRLTRASIQTGALTSFFALLVLGIFLQDNESSVASAFNFCLGRVYALTMLNSLNTRDPLSTPRRSTRQSNSSKSSPSGGSAAGEANATGGAVVSHIRIDRETGPNDMKAPRQSQPTQSYDESVDTDVKQWEPHTPANDNRSTTV